MNFITIAMVCLLFSFPLELWALVTSVEEDYDLEATYIHVVYSPRILRPSVVGLRFSREGS